MTEKLINLANRFKTPIAISALVVIVMFLIYQRILDLDIFSRLDENNTFILINNIILVMFYLAIIAILLGVSTHFYSLHLNNRNRQVWQHGSADEQKERFLKQIEYNNNDKGELYSKNQINTYCELWKSFQKLRVAGNDLWQKASEINLYTFKVILDETDNSINDNIPLFEKEDVRSLHLMFKKFNQYLIGKYELFEQRKKKGISSKIDPEIQERIKKNKKLKYEYEKLLNGQIAARFRERISKL